MLAKSGGGASVILNMLLIVILGIGVWFFGTLAIDSLKQAAMNRPAERVSVSNHGLKKHVEAKDLENACNKNGPYQVWKDRFEKGKYYFICKVGEAYGVIPIVVTASGLVGKTGFSPSNIKGDGTLSAVLFYLENLATRYNGALK